jgi:hypothetical protein
LVARRATGFLADGKFLSSETGVATMAAIERNTRNNAVRDNRCRNRAKSVNTRRLASEQLENSKTNLLTLNMYQFKTILSKWLKRESREIQGNTVQVMQWLYTATLVSE